MFLLEVLKCDVSLYIYIYASDLLYIYIYIYIYIHVYILYQAPLSLSLSLSMASEHRCDQNARNTVSSDPRSRRKHSMLHI